MKNAILLVFLFLSIEPSLWSQDVITTNVGHEIKAKVLKITQNEVEYKNFDNPDGPLYTIQKSDVLIIKYENGIKDVFTETGAPTLTDEESANLTEKGRADAQRYYKGYKEPMLWSAITTVTGYGVIALPLILSTPPRYENLNFPSNQLMENDQYRHAYMQKAFQIKKRKSWAGFGIGFGAIATVTATAMIMSINGGFH